MVITLEDPFLHALIMPKEKHVCGTSGIIYMFVVMND